MKKEHIIKEIERTAKENGGRALGVRKFEKETGIKESDWLGIFWTKWSDAVKEAGYVPQKRQEAYNDEFLLLKLIDLIREIGKFPTKAELNFKARNDEDFPSQRPFIRLGKKHERAGKIIEYCEKKKGFDDVIEICMPVCGLDKAHEIEEENDDEDFGFIYLWKYGKYYKIGRSYSPGRRDYELNIQNPEEGKLIHKIKTDDPGEIEKYWHNRFKSKRKKGEWFELTQSDVKAFKRRKFM